jgi:hypothetical protein
VLYFRVVANRVAIEMSVDTIAIVKVSAEPTIDVRAFVLFGSI